MCRIRLIMALALLTLACSGQFVEANTTWKGVHRRQTAWSLWGWPWNFASSFFDPFFSAPTAPTSVPPAPTSLPAGVSSLPPQPGQQPPLPPVPAPAQSVPPQPTSLAPVSSAPQIPPASSAQSSMIPQAPLASALPVPSATPTLNYPPSITPASPATTSSLAPAFTPMPSSSLSPNLTLAPAPTATSLPATGNNQNTGCSNPRVRPEWRTLTSEQQASYLTAVKCLAKIPSKLLPGGDYRRYDDFENVHARMRTKIHWIAAFLPWHRHFIFLYERALRNECGYTGNLPRWDWTLDSKNMTQSPIWSSDPMVGFGSNGRNFTEVDSYLEGGVVTDGAFANWDLYYPEYHQLQRNYNLPARYQVPGRIWGSQYFDEASIAHIHRQSTYAKFEVALEGTDPQSTGPSDPGPHSIIHVIIGGDITPTSYAANEPLFYLHHANVDYHWWRWQNARRSTRLNAYEGPTIRGSTSNTARVTDALNYLSLSADIQVKDTMDTTSAQYCYTY